jgi:hypothetical protein
MWGRRLRVRALRAGYDAEAAMALATQWHDWCKALQSGLRATSTTATQLRALLLEVTNLMEFEMLSGH